VILICAGYHLPPHIFIHNPQPVKQNFQNPNTKQVCDFGLFLSGT
jgi:hypothetical protein